MASSPARKSTPEDTSSPDQRVAINHERGPALILAAPGSGKTWVITQRFLRLVRGGVNPERILCLTFNVEAGNEMRRRVRGELGALLGDPPLTTYHSWALSLVTDYRRLLGDEFENIRLATGAEHRIFVGEAIEEALKGVRGQTLYSVLTPSANVGKVSGWISQCKQEGVSPTALLNEAQAKLRKDPKSYEAREQRDVAKVYARLQQKYRQAGLMDHDDCISLATTLLGKPEVRRALRDYEYVMVDEYQDTNLGQAKMVERLAKIVRNNVLVVADDDQAIYGWRGATPESLVRLRKYFPQLATLHLRENRRSSPQIVGVNQQIIASSLSREDKVARAVRGNGPKPVVITAQNENDEAEAICDVIEARIAKGARPRDIGVLTRSNRAMDPIKMALQARGLTYIADGGNDYFRAPDVRNMRRLLEAVANPENEQAVLSCLGFGHWGMSDRGIQQVVMHIRKSDEHLVDLLADGVIPDLSPKDRDAGITFATALMTLVRESQAVDVRDLFELAAQASNSFDFGHLRRQPDIMAFNGHVTRMRSLVDEFLTATGTSQKTAARVAKHGALPEFLNYLANLEASGSETSDPLPDTIDAVRLSTVHQAKGREWRHVIVAGCVDGSFPARWRPDPWDKRVNEHDGGLGARDEHFEEELRLFYVAGTRAMDTLTYTWPMRYTRRKTVSERARFLDAVGADLLDFREAAPRPIQPARRRVIGPIDPDKPVTISHTDLENIKICGQRADFQKRGVPQQQRVDGVFGTLVHETLKEAMLKRVSGVSVRTTEALALWDHVWDYKAGSLKKQRPDLHQYGRQMVKRYVEGNEFRQADVWHFKQNFNGAPSTGKDQDGIPMLEYPFQLPFAPNAFFSGRFDRIDNRNGVPVIVDYKSGTPRPNQVKNNMQLRRYAVAASEILGAKEVIGQIHWLEDGTVSEVHFTEKQIAKDRELLSDQIGKAHKRLIANDLTNSSGGSQCNNCSFPLVCDQGWGRGGGLGK